MSSVQKVTCITAITDKNITPWFYLNSFLSLVPFPAGIHKGRGKKITRKTIKCKIRSSSKMESTFFAVKDS